MEIGPALIVETTEEGDRLWDRFEYVRIKNIAKNSDGVSATLSVERAFNGSPPPRDFPTQITHISSMPWDTRTKLDFRNFFINYAKDCPKDEGGRTATDIVVEAMVGSFREGGILERMGGIDLASGKVGVRNGTELIEITRNRTCRFTIFASSHVFSRSFFCTTCV
eukprot:13458676-Ditylum_brightwellii.AAC.1